jgi:hypothetical protein
MTDVETSPWMEELVNAILRDLKPHFRDDDNIDTRTDAFLAIRNNITRAVKSRDSLVRQARSGQHIDDAFDLTPKFPDTPVGKLAAKLVSDGVVKWTPSARREPASGEKCCEACGRPGVTFAWHGGRFCYACNTSGIVPAIIESEAIENRLRQQCPKLECGAKGPACVALECPMRVSNKDANTNNGLQHVSFAIRTAMDSVFRRAVSVFGLILCTDPTHVQSGRTPDVRMLRPNEALHGLRIHALYLTRLPDPFDAPAWRRWFTNHIMSRAFRATMFYAMTDETHAELASLFPNLGPDRLIRTDTYIGIESLVEAASKEGPK